MFLAASFSESKSKSEGGESKTEMDGLVLDDGAEVENRFQRGQALYLNYYSKKYVRHKVFGCWLDDV